MPGTPRTEYRTTRGHVTRAAATVLKAWAFSLAVAAVVVLGPKGAACRAADDSHEYWLLVEARAQAGPLWDFQAQELLKYADRAVGLYCENTDAALWYKGLASWVDVAGGLQTEYRKVGEDCRTLEYRPHVDAQFKTTHSGFALSNRCRLEYRDLDGECDVWSYRNLIKVRFPGQYTRFKLRGYVAEEPFITFSDAGFNKNRLTLGTTWQLTEGVEGEVFYLWEARKSDDRWSSGHILGTHLTFVLK
jgi:hypothetical protein